jgi:hypothetical protein
VNFADEHHIPIMSHDSAFAINHFLRSNGLAGLSEAGALMTQLAMFVRDDRHFGALLNACEPAERGHMYDALAPNVRFKARPLADYMIEAAQDAERRQLPTIGEDGHFKAFKVPEIGDRSQKSEVRSQNTEGRDAAIATEAVAEEIAKERLHVVCLLCTREDFFRGITKQDAVEASRAAGWRAGFKRKHNSDEREQVEICPRCVKARAPRMRAA